MKTIITLTILLLSTVGYSQKHLYSYDPSGNRVKRQYVVLRLKDDGSISHQDSLKESSYELKAYPNPFSDEVTITLNMEEEMKENVRIVILSETGQLIQELSMNQKIKKINTTSLAKGKYILQLFRKEESEEFILIKN